MTRYRERRERGDFAPPKDAANPTNPAGSTAAQSLDDLTVDDLKKLAAKFDLPVSGTKAELIERLRNRPT